MLVRPTSARVRLGNLYYTLRSFGKSRVLWSGLTRKPRARYVTGLSPRQSSSILRLSQTSSVVLVTGVNVVSYEFQTNMQVEGETAGLSAQFTSCTDS